MPFANAEDQRDFENRLAKYGFDSSALIGEQLTTSVSTITSLRLDAGSTSQFRPRLLKTSDFDQVKRWIGVPNELYDRVEPVMDLPRRLSLPGLSKRGITTFRREAVPSSFERLELTRADFSSEHLASVRSLARAYLDGDSRRLAEYKPWIEMIFPVVTVIVWPFFNVTVKSGSVLEFGPGPNVLIAYTLTIEEGGLVRSYGDLNVDATILRKTTPRAMIAIDPALLRLRHRLP